MRPVRIVDVATANPPLRVTQREILESIERSADRSVREKKLYRALLGEPSIETRHVAIDAGDSLESLFGESADRAAARFERQATRLGAAAVESLLQATGLAAQDVDALFITTCTGYLCPGLTSYVAQAIGFKESIYAVDLVGMGCGASLPALNAAWQYLVAHPDANAIVVSVEICSAAVYWSDDPNSILTNSIFGDGCAACLLTNEPGADGLELKDYASILWPQYRDALRYVTRNGRLMNVVSREVPAIVARAFQQVLKAVTQDFAIPIDHCLVHPGGRKILDEIEALPLGDRGWALTHSRDVLRNFGNMSSPSVLYVLDELLRGGSMTTNDTVGMFAFGSGLTAFGLLATCCERAAT